MIKAANHSRGMAPEIRLNQFGGVDYSTVSTEIGDRNAADMENMMLDIRGMLQQIPGYRRLTAEPHNASQTPVRMLTFNKKAGKFIKNHAGELTLISPDGLTEAVLYSGVAQAKMKDFIMGEYQYFINGSEYLRWNGVGSVESVENSAFVPTTVIGRLPSGGGTAFEAVNLLQPKRKNSFRGNGVATIYQLDTIGLDSTAVEAVVAGVSKAEGSGFTVNRATGQVTFTQAPPNGNGVDNVMITFSKTVAGYADRIKKCRFFAIFGVGNNLRVFLSGNPDYPNQDWYSGMQDPTYFPDLGYTKIGSEGVAIKGYALIQGALHILKEASDYDPTIWTRTIAYNADGTAYFPVRPNNSSIGLLATDSVKSINDVCYMLTRQGIYKITATYVADERGLRHISGAIDPKLLREEGLENAVAFDFNGRYGIAINGRVYVVDYNNRDECYVWNGFPVSCYYEHDLQLYFGSSESGRIFIENQLGRSDNTNMLDDKPIVSFWFSKMMAMGRPNYYKTIDNISATLVPVSTRANMSLSVRTDKRSEKLVKQISATRFDINDIDLNDFSLMASTLPQSFNKPVNFSDFIYVQIIIRNDVPGKGFAVTDIIVPYSVVNTI